MTDNPKFFEAAQALAQSLSQWDLLIIGASLILIVSNDYYRPPSRRMRAVYLLMLPAWCSLAYSIYAGILVQRYYVGYLFAALDARKKEETIFNIAKGMESATQNEISGLQYALICLALWLLIYIGWWVFSDLPADREKK